MFHVTGFLSTDDSEAPGNYGLLDVVAVLDWVKTNIVNFGGDSSRVTVFSGSGGAAAASLLAFSKLTKGLFITLNNYSYLLFRVKLSIALLVLCLLSILFLAR